MCKTVIFKRACKTKLAYGCKPVRKSERSHVGDLKKKGKKLNLSLNIIK